MRTGPDGGRAALATLALATVVACHDGGKGVQRSEDDEIFHNVCARCHGPDGTGGPPDPLGNPGPKNFTDPAFQASVTDAQIKNAIENGNRGMPAFGAVFTPAEVNLLVRRVRRFAPHASQAASDASETAR